MAHQNLGNAPKLRDNGELGVLAACAGWFGL
jgi:hypothetical protein